MHGDGFAALDLGRARQRGWVQLAVQPVPRLVRQQVQRPLPGRFRTQPFRRRQPYGMPRAIGIAKARHYVRGEFDLARGRAQPVRVGVAAEGFEQHVLRVGRRDFSVAARPEFVERRQHHAPFCAAAPHAFVDVPAPAHFIAPGRVRVMKARAPRELGEDIEVVARFALRRHGPVHGEHIRVARGTSHVATLKRGRGRQHDIGAAGQRRPPGFVHDHRFRFAPRVAQAVLVLMMMERVAARPIDQLDVGIRVARAIEFIFGARRQQHVGNARHRNGQLRGVLWHRHFGARHLPARLANAVQRRVAKRKAATGQADLTGHRRQTDQRPIRLFAMLRALQRPRRRQQAALRGDAAGQGDDGIRRHAANP